jgi:hypothetical protein
MYGSLFFSYLSTGHRAFDVLQDAEKVASGILTAL